MQRRSFLKGAASLPGLRRAGELGGLAKLARASAEAGGGYAPGRIANEYSLWLAGEREALAQAPAYAAGRAVGTERGGWRLVAELAEGTQVYEKHATHQGVIVYVNAGGEVARIPKGIGDLGKIRPRPTATPHIKIERPARYVAGPDAASEYILGSNEDPCYENVAALGAELVGWTLVANEEAGPERTLWLEADGRSRQFGENPQSLWAPDMTGRRFDPRRLLPSEYLYEYVAGYSKRTLLGGYLPAADIGVWNPHFGLGYEVMMVLPAGAEAEPMARVRAMLPAAGGRLIPAGDSGAGEAVPAGGWVDRYWQGDAAGFFAALLAIWRHWSGFFAQGMEAEVPDGWLGNAARAGIVLARCSYRGLEPSYQIGEGAYTKIPERSHALFPVAHYEFVWAQQAWGLAREVEPYFEHYLEHYILPNGEFVYNTQDQVEAPLNAGVFLANSARAFDHTGDRGALERRLPALRRMIGFVLERHATTRREYAVEDPRHGLIWGSPEADKGDPKDNTPSSHPYYFQNTAWIWRGLSEHARCLGRAGMAAAAAETAAAAAELRGDLERSLARTLAGRSARMRAAGITPFTPDDLDHDPGELSSYENHRYMMDWWLADWGDGELDEGHFRHRALAGEQMLGMNTDGEYPRTSNFMEHGTLAGRIRQADYRAYLMALYGNVCYAMDSGSRYAPEDALLPGNFPGEGSPYAWSAVINSTLQPTLGLRWLLLWEEAEAARVHLQKAAPKHWFAPGERIAVARCPTRFGALGWTTEARGGGRWRVAVTAAAGWGAEVVVHVHPPGGEALRRASLGRVAGQQVVVPAAALAGGGRVEIEVEA
ncbi:MAG TPA: hypothetical protein VMV31_11590 [Terriglobales bacterium]|nr:hypothetical protein [Terriglobales bacterium]